MTDIDWSKAPDWATHVARLGYMFHNKAWINDKHYEYIDSAQRQKKFEFSETPDLSGTYAKNQAIIIEARPLKPEWDGTGLPPVGSVVEIVNDRGYEIIYGEDVIGELVTVNCLTKSGDTDIVVVEFQGILYCFRADMCRPIRTERDKAIEYMMGVFDSISDDLPPVDNKSLSEIFGALFDHGYRKP